MSRAKRARDDRPEPAVSTGAPRTSVSAGTPRTPGPAEGLLELVLDEHARRAGPQRIDGVVIGRILRVDGATPVVGFDEAPADGLPASATVELGPDTIGREVTVVFERGDPRRPIVTGVLRGPRAQSPGAAGRDPLEAEVDGERVLISAQNEIVLRCGKASITLTRAGKIILRGTYVVSRSSGMNRIKGGAVEIN